MPDDQGSSGPAKPRPRKARPDLPLFLPPAVPASEQPQARPTPPARDPQDQMATVDGPRGPVSPHSTTEPADPSSSRPVAGEPHSRPQTVPKAPRKARKASAPPPQRTGDEPASEPARRVIKRTP